MNNLNIIKAYEKNFDIKKEELFKSQNESERYEKEISILYEKLKNFEFLKEENDNLKKYNEKISKDLEKHINDLNNELKINKQNE